MPVKAQCSYRCLISYRLLLQELQRSLAWNVGIVIDPVPTAGEGALPVVVRVLDPVLEVLRQLQDPKQQTTAAAAGSARRHESHHSPSSYLPGRVLRKLPEALVRHKEVQLCFAYITLPLRTFQSIMRCCYRSSSSMTSKASKPSRRKFRQHSAPRETTH